MDTAAALQRLLDERDVRETVTRVFTGTDRRDWKGVEACFSEAVTFDMTSLTGGRPSRPLYLPTSCKSAKKAAKR